MVLNCRGRVAFYGWLYVALYGILWPSYGFLSHFMVFYGRISSFLAVIDPNSFGLVLSILPKSKKIAIACYERDHRALFKWWAGSRFQFLRIRVWYDCTHRVTKKNIYLTSYVCNKQIFDGLQFAINKIFLLRDAARRNNFTFFSFFFFVSCIFFPVYLMYYWIFMHEFSMYKF